MDQDKLDGADPCAELECSAWRQVAVDSNRALHAYLRDHGEPEHYGMPVDGVRHVVERLQSKLYRLKLALDQIKDTGVPDIFDGGPGDMNAEAKRYCAAFGACISIAKEALDDIEAEALGAYDRLR